MKDKDSPPPKRSLKILNSREKKEINQKIKEQWGCEFDKELVFLVNNKNRMYIADRDIGNIDFSNLKIDNMGLYACNLDKGARLTIEGSQMLGPKANKNIVEISDEEVRLWFRGHDLDRKAEDCEGYVIIKNKDDFMGCGKTAEKGILNFVPKTRRILSSD
ncbi:hypothetical protein ACFL3V_06055 [Nanoarchaeota archaeon]